MNPETGNFLASWDLGSVHSNDICSEGINCELSSSPGNPSKPHPSDGHTPPPFHKMSLVVPVFEIQLGAHPKIRLESFHPFFRP